MSDEIKQDIETGNNLKSLRRRTEPPQEPLAAEPEVMKNKEQRIEEIVKKTALLPTEAKRAVCWIVENIDFIEQIADGDNIPEPEMEKYIEDAHNRKDYMMLAILLYRQRKEQDAEAEKQESR